MKKLRLIALFVVLAAVAANGSPHFWNPSTGVRCASSNDPDLCPSIPDGACDDWCQFACPDFYNVTGTCRLQACVCDGTPIQ